MRMFTRMQNRDLRQAERRTRDRVRKVMGEMAPEYKSETQRLLNEEKNPERQDEIRMEREESRDLFRQNLREEIRAKEEAEIPRRQVRQFRGALVGLGLLMALSCGMIYLRLRPQ